MEEIWKDIENFRGLYQVSNLGRVRSLDRDIIQQGSIHHYKGVVMSPHLSNAGYLMIRLSKNNRKFDFTIHRLVATAFIPNPNNFPCLNHKDENKENNNVNNLEWCSVKYNISYGTATLRRSKKMGKTVCQYSLDGNLIKTYSSIREAARETGFCASSIGDCTRGNSHQSYGFIWKALDDDIPKLKIIPTFAKNSAIPVVQYDMELNPIKTYPSAHAAYRETGIKSENISCCCRGEARQAGGFIWKRKGEIPFVKTLKKQKEVIQYDLNMKEIRRFESPRAASDYLGGGKSPGIRQCIYGKNKTAYGYIWRYANNGE